ncbi:BON domain-containing protein [Coleofasciculus sp.]|uniref:BON domain-containing protein n=1 Tax=Coleofasciculus sp. TaxID=3100458 RepID=UPI003A3D3EF0
MVLLTDPELNNQVKSQLLWDNRVSATDVNVTVDNGTAVLTGVVPSYRAKVAAAEDAWTVPGVVKVNNQLRVQYPTTVTVPADSEIAANIKTVLTLEPNIDSSKINVGVVGGVVTLTGTVNNYWKKIQAEEDAYGITGVIDVINELGVVPTEKLSDEVIARNIEAALERNFNVNVDNVTVKVSNGVVTLSGTVANWSAWQAAYNAAAYTSGVINVVDQLSIRYA